LRYAPAFGPVRAGGRKAPDLSKTVCTFGFNGVPAHGREVPNVSLRRGFGGSDKDRRKPPGWSRLLG